MRGLVERLGREPAPVTEGPVILPWAVAPPATEQEGETLLTSAHQLHDSIHAGADEIADRLVYRIRNPDRRQVAEAMLQGKLPSDLS